MSLEYTIEHVLSKNAVSLLHLIFKQSVQAVLASRCIVSVLRVGVLLKLMGLFLILKTKICKLFIQFLYSFEVPSLNYSLVLVLSVNEDDNADTE